MLRLRPLEWVPILLAILINVSTGLYAWRSVMTAMDAPVIRERQFQVLEAGKVVTTGLLVFAAGCWFWRLNRWIKER
jgi:hypothetical protein